MAANTRASSFSDLMANNGMDCSMIVFGNVWDNAAMESFFSSLKTERIGRKVYRTRTPPGPTYSTTSKDLYNPRSAGTDQYGYLSPVEFERKVGLA